MPLEVAKHAGFCVGVKEAVDTAFSAAQTALDKGLRCYSLGDVIHNPDVVALLSDKGVIPVSSVEDARGGMLILRSHGVTPGILASCKAYKIEVVDCTCPYVHYVHKAVYDYSSNGKPVIIVGDELHPEVVGIAGWCRGPVYIVSSKAEIEQLPAIENALVVSQTTFSPDNWDELTGHLRSRITNLTVRSTICSATDIRQREAQELAKKSDCMVIVGGKKSANTQKLFESCRALCKRTYLVERAADLPPHFADIHKDKIGIAAGASTPDWSLKEVFNTMNDMELKDQTMIPETEPAQEETPVIPDVKKGSEEEKRSKFMADVDASMVRIRTGQTVTGTVVQITDEEVSVNIGYKSDGMIKRGDLTDTDIQLGDEIEVEVVKVNDGEGNVLLSQRNIINRKSWEALMTKYDAGEYVEGIGKEAVKGGLIAMVDGVRAFVPASQLAQRYVEKIGQFVGQPMRLKIIEVDKVKKRIVASRKEVISEETAAKKTAAWQKITEGDVIKGIVRRFADFGAFVDLGGVDGLIHITDMSWSRIGHPNEILSINQEVNVKVLSMDRERERIQLGYKQLQPKPWDNIEEKYPVGLVLERNVVRIRPFGAFIELEPGVDGLVHISQCALTRVAKVEDALTVGQPVKVKVLSVDPEAKRISLSIKEVLKDEAFNYSDEIPGENEETHAEDVKDASAEEVKDASTEIEEQKDSIE